MASIAAVSSSALDSRGSEINQHEVASNILCEFLEVAFHHILYSRAIYATSLFERRRKYNIPVYMSRHPELNQYIRDVLMGIKPLLDKGEVERVALSIKNQRDEPVEKFVFHLQGVDERALREDEHLLQLEQDLRAVLLKISTSDAVLTTLPSGCTFAILVHTSESAAATMEIQDAVTGFPWVKAEGVQHQMLQHQEQWQYPSQQQQPYQSQQQQQPYQSQQQQYQMQQPPPLAKVTPLKVISSSIIKMQLYVDERLDKR